MIAAIKSEKEIPAPSEWRFVRVDKHGAPVFRRDTNETAEYVGHILNEQGIPFIFHESGSCFRIYNEEKNKNYQYYYSTGRWGVYKGKTRPSKHYSSQSIKDFLERFFLDRPLKEKEMIFDGVTYDHERDNARLTTQQERVFSIMSDGEWHTIRELTEEIGGSESSISTRIRCLRLKRFGGHRVEREYVSNGVFRYKLHINKE